jgi:hypothetical protein
MSHLATSGLPCGLFLSMYPTVFLRRGIETPRALLWSPLSACPEPVLAIQKRFPSESHIAKTACVSFPHGSTSRNAFDASNLAAFFSFCA